MNGQKVTLVHGLESLGILLLATKHVSMAYAWGVDMTGKNKGISKNHLCKAEPITNPGGSPSRSNAA